MGVASRVSRLRAAGYVARANRVQAREDQRVHRVSANTAWEVRKAGLPR